ncbi:APC family permease [Microbacterium sp.]|uniref:APC family permease n=1 Tax=Microbacterium sp. TaxID=51671 RepID=UPI002D79F708|nr:APC family permease [Microbacterium sp.]HET6300714.1 APC family permease [Microbacterium sp.]
MTGPGALARRLGLGDAVAIGLGAMIGAGVFAVWAPAAQAAGAGLLIGLVLAAAVAFCNATSSAQLAARYPTSGGTYIYGRERLGEWPGFLAGWSFVIGKTASCAAMAITFAAYAVPPEWHKPVAALAVAALTAVSCFGVTRTAGVTRVVVTVVLAVLAFVVVAGLASGDADPSRLTDGWADAGWYGVLQSAGLIFFAFAGYARIATMGEEVREPQRTIPRAIVLALSGTLVVYGVLGVVALAVLGPDALAESTSPLADVATVGGWSWAVVVVGVGAALAALGALLALIAGVGRTALAMARKDDLPSWLAGVHPRYRVPHRATIVLGLVVIALVFAFDLRGAIGFSSFGVLLYYFIANASAFTQPREERRFPRWLAVTGMIGCLVLVATLPVPSIVAGVIVLAVGAAYRSVVRLARRRRSSS